MISDALDGKFDLIITKSISRFARNTVDTLLALRSLKDAGCEVYFQKEAIWTFAAEGEFLLTLLSSFAQEESRSISQNITWGKRKKFAKGLYAVTYSSFLGYDAGMKINEPQAKIVRMIYRLYLMGYTEISICRLLENTSVLSPMGNHTWWNSTVRSILENEKYKGDALLQKKFTVDYMTKKLKKNEGELPQYYVTNGHEAIIPRKTFDLVQEIRSERRRRNAPYSCTHPLSSKILCPVCGSFFVCTTGRNNNPYWVCLTQRKTKEKHSRMLRNHIIQALCKGAVLARLKQDYTEISEILHHLDGVSDDCISSILTFSKKLCHKEIDHPIPDHILRILIKEIRLKSDEEMEVVFWDDEGS